MMKTTGESVVGKTWHQRENKVCCTSCEGGEIPTERERAREIEMQTERERERRESMVNLCGSDKINF